MIDTESTFFHEDDFCQIEILPAENTPQLLAQSEDIGDFSNKEEGYTDIYVREPEVVGLHERGITIAQLEAIFVQLTPKKRYEKVTTGVSGRGKACTNIVAYVDEVLDIYYKHEDGVIKHIWLIQSSDTDQEYVVDVLHELGSTWDLVLMDWSAGMLIDLKNRVEIKDYIAF